MQKSLTPKLRNWLIQSLVSSLAISSFFWQGLAAQAFTLIDQYPHVAITDVKVTNQTIDTAQGQEAEIKYCLAAPAFTTVGIYQPIGDTDSKIVKEFISGTQQQAGCYSYKWNGKDSGSASYAAGTYFYGITAIAVPSVSINEAYVADWLYIQNSTTTTNPPANNSTGTLKIVDTELSQSIFDPYDNQEVEISFTINKDAKVTLTIEDEDDEEIKTLIDDDNFEAGQYSIDWDGKDKLNDVVSQGEYTYRLKVSNSTETKKESGTIHVKKGVPTDTTSEGPRLKNVFATKASFDPDRKETQTIVFTTQAKADITVTVYDSNNNFVAEIYDKNGQSPGTYSADWDGYEALNIKGTYTYKVYAKNTKGSDTQKGEFEVENDNQSSKKPDVYRDEPLSIPYNPKNQNLFISFKLDREADITIEIRDEDEGPDDELQAYVIEEVSMEPGTHQIGWDGKDLFGEYLPDGVYQYKIVAENNKGKEIERGYFEIEGSDSVGPQTSACGGYTDVDETYKYCEAIKWATDNEVFNGYNDGSFKPNSNINRAESLKVVMNAMGVNTISAGGENLGFKDIDPYGWYMPFLKTALSLGVVKGYPNGTFQPEKPVSRIEGLVMILNTARVKDNIIIPSVNYGQPYYDTPNEKSTSWYIDYAWFARSYSLTDNTSYFYPGQFMTRGEMADMLYRYSKTGL